MTPEQEQALSPILRLAAAKVSRNFGTEYADTLNECWIWTLSNDKKTDEPRHVKLLDWIDAGRHRQALFAVVEGVGRDGYGRKEKAARLNVKPSALDRRKLDTELDRGLIAKYPAAKLCEWCGGPIRQAHAKCVPAPVCIRTKR